MPKRGPFRNSNGQQKKHQQPRDPAIHSCHGTLEPTQSMPPHPSLKQGLNKAHLYLKEMVVKNPLVRP